MAVAHKPKSCKQHKAVLWEGYLEKRQQGGIRPHAHVGRLKFQKRYCRLSHDKLQYFSVRNKLMSALIDQDIILEGEFLVKDITIVAVVPYTMFSKKYCFQIGNEREMLYFAEKSERLRETWINTVETATSLNKDKMATRYHVGAFRLYHPDKWGCCDKGKHSRGCHTSIPRTSLFRDRTPEPERVSPDHDYSNQQPLPLQFQCSPDHHSGSMVDEGENLRSEVTQEVVSDPFTDRCSGSLKINPSLEVLYIESLSIFRKQILGSGAFGCVFKGKLKEQDCAVKVLNPLGMEFTCSLPAASITSAPMVQIVSLERFKKECKFLESLRHKNIVRHLATLTYPGPNLPVLVLELMDCSLRQYLSQHSPLLSTQLGLCSDIASAIEYLHQNDIVHRDLCGDNVLIKIGECSGRLVAKVTDFGMSRIIDADSKLTDLGHREGYLPPEASLISSKSYDSSLDVFMFGVIMIQIFTNTSHVTSAEERLRLIDQIDGTHPLKSIILQCLNDVRDKRPHITEVCIDLCMNYTREIVDLMEISGALYIETMGKEEKHEQVTDEYVNTGGSDTFEVFLRCYHKMSRVVSQYYRCAETITHIPFIDPVTVLVCDYHGIEHSLVGHDITLTIPEGAIYTQGKVIHIEMGVALYGPFIFPSKTRPISPILWICPQDNVEFNQPIEVTLPHFLTGLGQKELTELGVSFIKANHNDYGLGSDKSCNDASKFLFKKCSSYPDQFRRPGYGTLKTRHCCFICLKSNQHPELARKAGFCFSRIDYVTESLTYGVNFL